MGPRKYLLVSVMKGLKVDKFCLHYTVNVLKFQTLFSFDSQIKY